MKSVKSQINVRIKNRLAHNDRIFFPDQFKDICSTEVALEILSDLAAKGELTARAQIYGPGGHICFDDEIELLDGRIAPFPCCGRELGPKDAVPYFVLQRDPAYPEGEGARPREALERILYLSDRKELREIYAIAAEALNEKPPAGTCKRPPEGWYCTLSAGHEGPCPAWDVHTTRGKQ